MKRRTFIQTIGVAGSAAILTKAAPMKRYASPPALPDNPEDLLVDLVDAATDEGAVYADARYIHLNSESLSARKDTLYSVLQNETVGIAVRVFKNGNWGYAGTSKLQKFSARSLASRACALADAAGDMQSLPFSAEGRITKELEPWSSPYRIDPFTISLNEKTEFLLSLTKPPLEKEAIVYTVANLFTSKKRVVYVNSLGGKSDQTYVVTYPNFGITAFYQKKGRIDSRNSDIEPVQAGWEIATDYGFEGELERATNEVLEKNDLAQNIQPGGYDLILSSSHLWKIFYDTLAPHLDPYAVYSLDGDSPANRLFSPEDVGAKKLGTALLNVDYNNSLPRGLATTQVDDAGRKASPGKIFENGALVGLPSSDELAGLGSNWNGFSTRGEGWEQEPKFAMPNMFIRPGSDNFSTQDLAKDVSLGLLISGRSQTILSADRRSFRTTGQLGWLIENGKIKHMIRDYVYEASTQYFWNMLDALGGKDTVTLGGDIFPQNNSAIWMSPFSIAAPSARFTNINVFSLAGGVK